MASDRYYLKATDESEWREVTEAEFRATPKAWGFRHDVTEEDPVREDVQGYCGSCGLPTNTLPCPHCTKTETRESKTRFERAIPAPRETR